MNVGQLKELLSKYPDDTVVAINEPNAEATGLLRGVTLCNDASECPYDKGESVYSLAAYWRNKGRPTPIESNATPILFLES